MGWRVYSLTYELQSPLHIGYHKVGNVQRTRYYVPARNLWAACTERLVRSGFSVSGAPAGDYQRIGQWLREHCAFTYFFVAGEESLCFPNHTSTGLCYGKLPTAEFERRFVRPYVATALEAVSASAANDSLHEVELVVASTGLGSRTTLRGWCFLDERGLSELGGERWHARLSELQIGGERRYGFGCLRLVAEPSQTKSIEEYVVTVSGRRPTIRVEGEKPLLAHTPALELNARGMLEPLVGRETTESSRFGQKLTRAVMYWAPGAVCEDAQEFSIGANGTWEVIRS